MFPLCRRRSSRACANGSARALRSPRSSSPCARRSSPSKEKRAWALVALASRLRREHELELARLALNAALALDASPEPTRAAYTCAVALHADEGDLTTALKLGEGLLADGQQPPLLRAMARVYWGLWKETKDESWHDRWWHVNVQLRETSPA